MAGLVYSSWMRCNHICHIVHTHIGCYLLRSSGALPSAFDVTFYDLLYHLHAHSMLSSMIFCNARTHTQIHTETLDVTVSGQGLDCIWDGLKSFLPRQLSIRQLIGNQLKLQMNRYVWIWYWKHCKAGSPKDLVLELAKLMMSTNKKYKIGYWKSLRHKSDSAKKCFRCFFGHKF